MLKKAALAFGVVYLLIGILGFIPAFVTHDSSSDMKLLLGLFMVGALHNIIHLASGVVALGSSGSENAARWFFRVFGVVYAFVTIIGFVQGDTVLGLMHVNMADNLLHLVIALASLYLGFGTPTTARTTTETTA